MRRYCLVMFCSQTNPLMTWLCFWGSFTIGYSFCQAVLICLLISVILYIPKGRKLAIHVWFVNWFPWLLRRQAVDRREIKRRISNEHDCLNTRYISNDAISCLLSTISMLSVQAIFQAIFRRTLATIVLTSCYRGDHCHWFHFLWMH